MTRTKKLKLVDRYFSDLNQQAECEELEQKVSETAVKRFRFERQYRRMWEKLSVRQNYKRPPFGIILKDLVEAGRLPRSEKNKLQNAYNKMSRILHQS